MSHRERSAVPMCCSILYPPNKDINIYNNSFHSTRYRSFRLMFSVKWMPGIPYQDAFHTRGRKCIAQKHWCGQYTVCESRSGYIYNLSVYCGQSEAITDPVVCLL
jgi:hypothetical protein